MAKIKSPLINFLNSPTNTYLIEHTLKLLRIYELYPANWFNQGLFKTLCFTVPELCKLGDYLTADEDPSLHSDDTVKVVFAHYPAGASLK